MFEKADAGQPTTYTDKLKGADAVFISVGAAPVPNYFYKGGKAVSVWSHSFLSRHCILVCSVQIAQ